MQSSLIMANYSIRTDKGSVIPMQKIRRGYAISEV